MTRAVLACVIAVLSLLVSPAYANVRPEDPALAKVFSMVNKVRAKPQICGAKLRPAVKKLRFDRDLSVAAQLHAEDMATNAYFSHESLDGRTFVDRIAASEYAGRPAGENLASGQQSAREVVVAWLRSPSHCRNLMAKRFDAVGLGLAQFDDPQYSAPITYWVQDFGYDD
jgi:uncharacterized protein YkwD